jgi:NADPH:quinone reductase-like Zn-dependent oxidoreductase
MPDLAPPFVIGSDVAGTVLDGDGTFASGTRVAALAPWFLTREGTYAEVVSVDPAWLAEIPASVDDVTAAAAPLVAETGLEALDQVNLQAGQTVLILGASGAVGSFAVQGAVRRGAEVVAVASAHDEQYVTGLGAKVVISRGPTTEDLVAVVRERYPDGVDTIVDPAGAAAIGALRDGGIFGAVVALSMPDAERGIDVRHVQAVSDGGLLTRVLGDLANGIMTIRVGLTLPFDQVVEAHKRVQDRSVRGKIVLTW